MDREIKTFSIGLQSNGIHNIKWDGRNNLGNTVPTGIYFYQLQTGSEAQAKKMIFTANTNPINITGFGKSSLNSLESKSKITTETKVFTSKNLFSTYRKR